MPDLFFWFALSVSKVFRLDMLVHFLGRFRGLPVAVHARALHSVRVPIHILLLCVGVAMANLHLTVLQNLYVSHWGVQSET